MRILRIFKSQFEEYRRYKAYFTQETGQVQIRVLTFIAMIFLLNFIMNIWYNFVQLGAINTHNYLELAYAIYLITAAFLMRWIDKRLPHYTMSFSYFNAALLLAFIVFSELMPDYYLSFAITSLIIYLPVTTIYAPFCTYGLLLLSLFIVEFSVLIIPQWAEGEVVNYIYYILESAIIYMVAIIVNLTVFSGKVKTYSEISRLKKQRDIDALTGLLNRSAAQRMIGQYNADDAYHSMVVIDVDHFKQINDSHGHTKGDQLLMSIADYLRENFAEADVIARFGGDEFIIFYANCRDRALLNQLTDLQCRRVSELGEMISLSIGYAQCKAVPTIDIFKELFDKADSDMYKNKYANKCR